jgi:hypothetical protein
MIEGAVAKYAKENALLSQLFVMDGKTPVSTLLPLLPRPLAPRSSWWTMSASSWAKALKRKKPTSPPKWLLPA